MSIAAISVLEADVKAVVKSYLISAVLLQGNVSFDNIGRALLQVLQVVSLESWSTTQMYYMLDGVGSVVVIYYLCLIVIGTYFALNLLVAVISAKFAQLHVSHLQSHGVTSALLCCALCMSHQIRGGGAGEGGGRVSTI